MSNDKSTATLGQSPPWTSAVAEEPDYIENDYEEDEALSEQERSEMERLREAAINFMDGYLEKTLTNLEKASLKNRSVFDKDINPVDGEEYAAETRVVMNECRKVMLNVFIKCFAKRMRDEPK
ncbi:hypothetical protein PInf_008726 [Phytophthora infestans]|nr:hypothetical protein PInf_008726 [Phytophthora infestans]